MLQTITITHTATGGSTASVMVSVTVKDDDEEGVSVSTTSLAVVEPADGVDQDAAAVVEYTVQLTSAPTIATGDVMVTVSKMSNPAVGALAVQLALEGDTPDEEVVWVTGVAGTVTLTFTAANWDTAQTVFVRALKEDADGGMDNETSEMVDLLHNATVPTMLRIWISMQR